MGDQIEQKAALMPQTLAPVPVPPEPNYCQEASVMAACPRTMSDDDLIAAYKEAVGRRNALRRDLDLAQIDVNDLYLEVVTRAEVVQERARAERARTDV